MDAHRGTFSQQLDQLRFLLFVQLIEYRHAVDH